MLRMVLLGPSFGHRRHELVRVSDAFFTNAKSRLHQQRLLLGVTRKTVAPAEFFSV